MQIRLTTIVALSILLLGGCAKRELCPGEQYGGGQFTRIQTNQKVAKKKASPSMIYTRKSSSNGNPPVIFANSKSKERAPSTPITFVNKNNKKDKRKTGRQSGRKLGL